MRARRPAALDPRPGFDMTPIIDVTFQLILFFLLSMQAASARIETLTPPEAATARVSPPDEGELVVNVTADGRLRLAGKTFTDGGLEAEMETRARRAGPAGFPVLIRADRSAAFEHVQKVMMMASARGGVTRVRFGARVEGSR